MPRLGHPKSFKFSVLTPDDEFTGKLAPGGAFVLKRDGDIILHVWGVKEAAEFGEEVYATAKKDFFKAMKRALSKALEAMELDGITQRTKVEKGNLVLSNCRPVNPNDRRLKEYRLWRRGTKLRKGDTLNKAVIEITEGKKRKGKKEE